MAKKRVVVNNGKKKKKRHGCCTCVLVVFIVFIVILGAGVGVGWYFGDKYTKQYLDMSLKDCFGVVRDLTHAKEKKIVTKGYAGTSETEFEEQLKKQLFLNENADLNKDTLMEQIVGKGESKQSEILNAALRENGVYSDGGDGEDNSQGGDLPSGGEEEQPSQGDGDNAIMNYVASLFTRENMDIDKLRDYDESKHTEYILNFTDVQLAAFLSSVIKDGLNSEAVTESGALASISEILGDKSLSDVVYFDQVVFYGTAEDPHIKITLSADIRTVANGYISSVTGMNLGFVPKIFLPKRVFITADVAMSGDGQLNLFINEMNAEKMDRFYKLINGLSNLGGGEKTDIRETINNGAGKVVGGVANAMRDYGDVSEISDGKVKIDLFEALIGVSNLNEGKDEAQALKSSDIIYALKYVVASDFEEAIETEYTWKDRYYNSDDPSVPAVYKKASEIGDKDVLANYEEELLKELERKYLIKRVDDNGNERSFADLMKLFGIGDEGGDKTILDWIDSKRLGELAAQDGDISVVITDEMLGAIFNAEINSMISSGGSVADMQPEVYQVHIEKKDGKYFMHAGLAVKADGIVGNAGAVGSMISGIFGDKMMLKFVMEITPDAGEGYEYAPTTLALNNLEQDEMERLMSILSKLGADLSTSSLAAQIETPMRDALTNMKKQMPGLTFETSKILMADLFSVTVDKVLVDDETGRPIKYASTKDGEKDTELNGTDLKGVINSLYNYDAPENNVPEGSVDYGTLIASGEITQEQLGQYIRTWMQGDEYFRADKFTNLIRVDIVSDGGEEYVKFIVEVDKNNLFEDGNDGGDFNKFVGDGVEKVYAEITVDLKRTEQYRSGDEEKTRYITNATVNGMSDVERRKFEAVVGKFNPGGMAQISFDDRAQEIGGTVYNLLTAFKGAGGNIAVENGVIKKA